MTAFGLEFPVMVDDVISANTDHPGHERPRLRPVRIESSIHLHEDLLREIFGLVKSSREAVSQIVDPLVVLANYVFPGTVVAGQAPFNQVRIGCLQPFIWLRPLPLARYESTKCREEKFQRIPAFLR